MRMVPKRANHLGTGFKKSLDVLGEGIGFFALDIDCPDYTLSGLVEDGNDHECPWLPNEGWVAHISLVFREMWDSTALSL
jgi:hypothetical protein